MIQAVLFDLDGTLIETEYETFQFYQEWLKKHKGIIIPDASFKYKAGVKSDKFFNDALTPQQLERFDYQALVDLKREKFNTEMARYANPVLGGRQLIARLYDDGLRLAIVSQNERRMVDSVVDWMKIRNFFEIILSMDDIVHKKPDPQCYILAAQRLNVSPAKCVVIEDSFDGIRSAKNAGMYCIALFHKYMPAGTYTNADSVVHSLKDITSDMFQKKGGLLRSSSKPAKN